jgi:hypothetical protein
MVDALPLTLLVHFAVEDYPNPGRNPFETWTICVRGLAQPLDGERATLAKQALPLNWSNGSVLRRMLRQVLRWFANSGASRVASFGCQHCCTQQMRACEPANFPSDIFP